MPELPEVETIANGLRQGGHGIPPILGMRFSAAQVFWPRTIALLTPQEFIQRIVGQTIQTIGRRGKYLHFQLNRDSLLLHLRMSGDVLVEAADAPALPHHRLLLTLQDGWRLAFHDTRKFGRAWLTDQPESILGALGPEPFDPALTAAALHQRLHARRRQIKPLLLDQTFLAGMGNIYTDETLHRSRLHPCTPADTLSPEQAAGLLANIRLVLQEAIGLHGASIDWVYRGGDFQNHFQVYQRTGLPCKTCGMPVERILVGQRGTHFCPRCQPLR